MRLLLDVGNSRLKWAFIDGAALTHRGEALHAGSLFAPLVEEAWSDFPSPDTVLVSNVAGEDFASQLADYTRTTWGVTPELITPAAQAFGVTNAYTEPAQLGADRWAALVAAHHEPGGPACIVDCGSAVTIDALNADGGHLGGLILPGLSMMRQCLAERARGVAVRAGGEGNVSLLARDTQDAVIGGTLYALVAALDRITADVVAELGGGAHRILTGGDAAQLLPLLQGRWQHEPDLVLKGLAVMSGGGG
ncbi:MAG: type III pantothenate kinase [Gammaproteobacteria bacterium]|nr:type III pantothenate kinase [Gammaproteobacteria bacterium]